jgi:c-di-GMP-binding flagellar brake protein YcgR
MERDKRRAERHKVRFKLVYDDGETFNAGTVRDVSETGLFLETALPLAKGTKVTLMPVDSDEMFEASGKVVRIEDYEGGNRGGMGIEFVDIAEGDRRAVVEVIRKLESNSAKGEVDPYLGVKIHRNE